ncbi:MAG: hypothetical protein L0207_06385 [Chlamydiae bacterium]|nr:hypothetical protein [Chlamydiota bacterium]
MQMQHSFDWQEFKKVFFPLSILLALSGILTVVLKAFFLEPPAEGTVNWSSLLTIFFGACLLFWAKKSSYERIIKTTIFSLIVLLIFFAVGIPFFSPKGTFAFIFYNLIAGLSPGFFYLFGWFLINQVASFKDGMKYFIPVFFLSTIIAVPYFILHFYLQHLHMGNLGNHSYLILYLFISLAIICLGAISFIHDKLKKYKSSAEDKEEISIPIAIIALTVITTFFGFIENWQTIGFKALAKQLFSSSISYTNFMGKYAVFTGVSTISLLFLAMVGGYVILQKKGWKFLTCFTAFLSLAGGAVAMFLAPFISTAFSVEMGWISASLFKITDLPLVQIAFLLIPFSKRIASMIWVWLILTPALKMVMQQLNPMIAEIFWVKAIVFFLFSIAIFASIFFLSRSEKIKRMQEVNSHSLQS